MKMDEWRDAGDSPQRTAITPANTGVKCGKPGQYQTRSMTMAMP